MTLVEFLRARLNEDQHAARIASACSVDGQYDAQTWCVAEGEVIGDDGTPTGIPIARARWEDVGVSDHIARHDPARVLAEVVAKRQIVELHGDQHECPDWQNSSAWPYVGCDTLRLLALPYAEHPDYRQEWKP